MRLPAMLLLLASLSLTASAETTSATMNVSVHVVARAVVTIEAAPADILITTADLARGYVVVPAPLQFRVKTNSRRGCLLQVAKTNDEVFSSVELSFSDTTMNVEHESWVTRPYVAAGEVIRAEMRVRLSATATAGRHALPVEVSASPL